MSEKIIEALKGLDPENNEHWTADGAPKLSALKIEGVTRAEVVKAAPHFNRLNPSTETPAMVEAALKTSQASGVPDTDAITLATAERDDAKDILEKAALAHRETGKEVQKAMTNLDEKERELAALIGQRSSQHDIMDYIAASNARRLEQARKEGRFKDAEDKAAIKKAALEDAKSKE